MRIVGRLLGLRRRRGEHPPRGQLIDPIDGMPVGDLCQDILEVCLGIYAVEASHSLVIDWRIDGKY